MKTRFNPFLAAAVVSLLTLQVHGVEIIKANNADSLNLPTSWIGAAAPAAADIAVWDGTVTGANSVALGADLAWQGINPFSPGLPVTLTGPNTLSLGSSGIDLSGAAQNLTISTPLVVAADQTWTAGSGRALIASAAVTLSTDSTLTLSGTGTVRIGPAGYATGSAGAVVVNGPTWILGSSGANRSGTTTLTSGIISINPFSPALRTAL